LTDAHHTSCAKILSIDIYAAADAHTPSVRLWIT
jgi:hypothetical protein